MAVMKMCKVFWCLCTKVYNLTDFKCLEANVVESMAFWDIEFPSSFFDIITHLSYHLAKEFDLCGLLVPTRCIWLNIT